MQANDIQKALEWRYATKRFDTDKKISEKDWKVLETSLHLSPSSYGLQPWKFLVIENPELRKKLREVSWNQTQVTDASHLVVFAYKENVDEKFVQDHINQVSRLRSVPLEALDGYKNMMVQNVVHGKPAPEMEAWTQRQAYIAMGFLMETAALLQIDACPMEGLDPKAYNEILQLNGTGWKAVSVIALGYRHAEDGTQHAKKVRFPVESVVEYRK